MRGFATLVLIALVASALPNAAADAHDGAAPLVIRDAEGDANEWNSRALVAQQSAACFANDHVPGVCRAVAPLPTRGMEPMGGVPAAPSMDLLSVTLRESPEALVVTMEVAALDAEWSGVWQPDEPSGFKQGAYSFGWTHEGDCFEMLYVWITDADEVAAGHTYSSAACAENATWADTWGGGCNAWWWCEIEVPYEVEPGTPGRVTFRIPRDAILGAEQGQTLQKFFGGTLRGHAGGRLAAYHLVTPARETHGALRVDSYWVDRVSDASSAFTFETERVAWPRGEGPHKPQTVHEAIDARGDILAFDILETPETVTLRAQVRQVEASTPGLSSWGAMALPSGHVFEFVGLTGTSGTHESYGRYSVPDEGPLGGLYQIVLPIEATIEPGEPGYVSYTARRADLPPVLADGISTLAVLAMGVGSPDGNGVRPAEGFAASAVSDTSADLGDYTGATPLYRFLHDTPLSLYEGRLRVADPVGDARAPEATAADATVGARFDITYVEARTVSAQETHLTVGVRDLSRATVPAGYDGMFYALGAQAGDRATMIGYYKQKDAPSGDFLCAPDITVLSETQRDPTEAVWTIITGVVTAPPSASGAGGAGGPGALTFHVPHECFGGDVVEDGAFALDRLSAATFLTRTGVQGATPGFVEELDATEPIEMLALPLPAPPAEAVAAAAWYEAPFGFAHFWDVLGLGVALVVAGAGGAMKLRRRTIDRRALADAKAREDRDVYRAALARAVASESVADPASDEVLRALRARLNISEREHALMELEARAQAGLAIGGIAAGSTFLGKFRIERQLGQGSFARTLLARDEKLDRLVVLKIARWPTPKEMRRALHEGRMLARMDHPNIVKIHDVEEVADQVVLVLEHVPRGSLADFLEGARVPAPAALALADGVLAGLEAAHAEGVVHRDVKPGNVLLARDGRPKLADFGIAQSPTGTGTVTGGTLAGDGAGTLRYMSPEQARGEPATARSDLYGVGALLYELVAGKPYLPFDGLSEYEARNAIQSEQPDLPLPGVPDEVNALLARLLAKDPAARPADAGAARAMIAAGAGAPLPP